VTVIFNPTKKVVFSIPRGEKMNGLLHKFWPTGSPEGE